MEWETVIGLEVHIQLATQSKIFSGAATAYGALPNTQACAIDLGLPGVLPVLNQEAVKMAVKFALASDSKVNPRSIFSRKHYFYADLPKGYQISQYDQPIVHDGHLDVRLDDGKIKRIGITRAHLEEDAGKSLHEDFQGLSGIDLNRAGTPLLEIVSEPDMRSAEEAVAYLKALHSLVRYLEICDGNMQEGSFRVDVNVSVRPKGQAEFGTRTETKNLNSFRFIDRAIHFEVERQIQVLESGGIINQETRLFDAMKGETRPLRSKEDAHDYRYFPDPDLLPVAIEANFIDEIQATMPEFPEQKRLRFVEEYQLNDYDADVLTANRDMANFYEQAVKTAGGHAKLVANFIMGDFSAALNKELLDVTQSPISASELGGLIARVGDNTISGKIAKEIFIAMWEGQGDADSIINKKGLKQITDPTAIAAIVDDVIAANPTQLEQYRSGKDKLFGFFVGQAMKASKGKANPAELNKVLKHKLSS
ncbi:Aspartyl/glutamyl-tRNA(Asn/Gln) amidotransferase subunit B [Piscirickettsia salmonis]|uniref:Aspartyl/glutamyl-tRNA(Asn/Gln) amidotransferase subunit B n=1 Tax=Piscirickettsia salmonis TaxID=1238 RepID=A0A1L6T9N0_PISSA|nr:Asp-tRNA(Asn)/Glu-tRNA(Gln) amidotransferase subunit GatB [Piscirickettsia salmonis]AKP73194.1 glutamyl-tRNA amidotransferase [Piscirickettsia salmonis LF-89 = ATCC VR-1361]ALB21878.1 Aspartyl/glutamyl-tRNA(Asn/Gln) amidotransferase, B subunit [Piscirickettsia salmonis]AMA41566.1 glutamyl-tRNA amidotransferase [Piscirickettsia salmonis]AOS34052.1 glutamyl-tRNA amidotransferase [Piscirickettsia salmonis]APS61454.1 glutamyl-tRNA amidotransferase [Piscirickettsia salmonis]